jgi:GDP-L-fucose synthase
LIEMVVGYLGILRFYYSRPDGPPRKLLDTSRINALGWMSRIELTDGIADAYAGYLEHVAMTAPRGNRAG